MTDRESVHYTGYIILSVGLVASNIICKVIIGTLAKKEISVIQPEAIVAGILALLIRLAPSIVLKKSLVVIFFLTCVGYSYLFSYMIVQRISKYLNIKILTV